MLVHSRTMAPTSGWRATSSFPASTTSRSACAMSMSSVSALIRTRKNSLPFSVPTSGVSNGTPAPSRWAGDNVEPDTVTRPTRFPGGSVACTQGTCIRDEVATGTPTAAAISFWNSERKPQFVVMACAQAHQFVGRLDEVRKQASRALQYDLLRRGALHHAIEHGERPRRRVTHVAGNAWKAGFQHQNAQRRAIERLAATGDAGANAVWIGHAL